MNDDAGRQFVDTNILVYAHDAVAGPKHDTAKALLQDLWNSRWGCLSIQMLQEFYVTVTQKVTMPYSAIEAAKIIEDFAAWRIHAPTVSDVLAAIDLQNRYQLSFWDAMMLQSAGSLGCTVVWTEDLNHGQMINQVLIQNPFQQA
jgi:predicted nucleic acid-binding protein